MESQEVAGSFREENSVVVSALYYHKTPFY
jgi:hypothetical protein